jgi:hypothetical protein
LNGGTYELRKLGEEMQNFYKRDAILEILDIQNRNDILIKRKIPLLRVKTRSSLEFDCTSGL